ncbi:MAG: bifunctional GTP diphosphokinase/guanosine-3',5'-bis pyrophosphate 3'-pyrophosphohydrolase [Chromatiales bacterium]
MENRLLEEKPRYLISHFCADLEEYLPPEQIREVYRAYLFSAEAHSGQKRMSGEPYIYHPIAVAKILADMRMDYKCLMAAILHDVIEDTGTGKEQLIELFDEEIAELVDGVSKLTNLDFKSHAEMQAANVRKMLLAMTRDIRVILIKLADRLHNMRTLGVMRPDKARRIARETLEIYAPIASRLGIYSMRVELETLGFQSYYPWRYRIVGEALARLRGNRREVVEHIESSIRNRLDQENMPGAVIGREKNLCSIYRKMQDKNIKLSDLADVYAFRIIVDDVDSCYRVLGAVHNLYKPVPGKFKDYIAIPKANGYQSLHTVLFGPHGLPIEVQIRTRDMDRVAESGIAAHWRYKINSDSNTVANNAAAGWLNNLLELQKGAGNSEEFLEHVKIDLFPDEVYVFTPLGKIMELPKGATVIDFAYAVHSDVGNHCVAARVDRKLAPLRSRLFNGQTVEILTSPNARPSPAWLDVVITGKARANIRTYLKQLQHREATELGRRLLEKELEVYGQKIEDLSEEAIQGYLDTYGLPHFEALLEDIALGNRMALMVARHIIGVEDESLLSEADRHKPLAIRGTEGLVVKYAKCCRPIPGDPIGALFRPGTGIVVHHRDCRNLTEANKQGDSWLDVQWEDEMQGEFTTEIRVEVGNQRGVLAEVAATISDTGSNIEHVHTEERDGVTTALTFIITVLNRKHLAKIMRRLRALPPVIRIVRTFA